MGAVMEMGVATGVISGVGTEVGVGLAGVGRGVDVCIGVGTDVGSGDGTAVDGGKGVGTGVGSGIDTTWSAGAVVAVGDSVLEQATANAETIAATHTANPIFNASPFRPSDTCSASPHSLLPELYDYPTRTTHTISPLSSVNGPLSKSPNT